MIKESFEVNDVRGTRENPSPYEQGAMGRRERARTLMRKYEKQLDAPVAWEGKQWNIKRICSPSPEGYCDVILKGDVGERIVDIEELDKAQ